ncbi:glycosyltransferase family 25 protein [Pasteurella canis]|uniref:glycosyltransferase family 25 protein n=1 Tax=Pasteurella canis TaxID=753 RepID=UPI000D9411AD|nr:glycosyltransferase family 25 protein [Pasteurella canis]UEA17198.1 glycosyltransferase family 25 protein [Pasteurella canis]SPY33437.1 Beta-1,4 galactosyltransferase [Pasteurella canis]
MHTNYVISLTSASTRREHIKNEFGRQNIPFEFFDALVPSLSLDNAINEHLPNLAQASLSTGEKACFMSHYMLWQKCLNENLPYIFIFEDDILLGESAQEFLNEEQWLEERFETDSFILRLETFLQPAKCEKTIISPYLEREFHVLKQVHYGTAGYIISQQAIKNLINTLKQYNSNDLDAIDIMLFRKSLNDPQQNIFQLSPALCVQELQLNQNKSQFKSQLEQERIDIRQQNKTIKPKRSFKEKLNRLRYNIIRAITKYQRIKQQQEALKHIIPFK